jgi:hypothetical protein
MNTKNVIPALALLLTGSMTAQADIQKAQAPHVQVKDAAAVKPESAVQLEFTVTGLTKENREKVQQSLTSLKTQVYVCTGCKHEQDTTGKCAPCKLDLVSRAEPMLLEAVPTVDSASIRLIPMGARTMRYSDLVGALTKNSIQIDAAKFPLAGKSRLVLRGGSAENAEVIAKALVDAKLFQSVEASFDSASGEIRIAVHANATPPMQDKVSAVIDALGTKAKLADVVWGPSAPPTKA